MNYIWIGGNMESMSDEEKKEYEELKSLLYTGTISQYGKRKLIEIIEKQSKEIEELKKEYERVRAGRNWLSEHISAQIATPELFDRLVEENYISKDKIKAKIEEVIKEGNYRTADNPNGRVHFQKEITDYQIEVLQSLLEKE